MELQDVVRRSGTCRYFKPDPVSDADLRTLFEAARFAPQGGNRQPVRWVVVRDAAAKRRLRDWYLEPWKRYMAGVEAGTIRVDGEGPPVCRRRRPHGRAPPRDPRAARRLRGHGRHHDS